jgi:hypothetical protein
MRFVKGVIVKIAERVYSVRTDLEIAANDGKDAPVMRRDDNNGYEWKSVGDGR